MINDRMCIQIFRMNCPIYFLTCFFFDVHSFSSRINQKNKLADRDGALLRVEGGVPDKFMPGLGHIWPNGYIGQKEAFDTSADRGS
jgi:hypothetical protein